MPGQTSPAAARESIKATRVHPSPTDLRYQVALQRYISALSPARGSVEQATHSTWLWNADHLLVRDMMTTNVVTISPSTPFKTVVGLLGAHRISAVPVVDEANKVVGIVSESDLLAKVVAGDRSGQRLPGTRSDRRAVRARTGAETAADLMTAEPITVRADKSLSEAARMAAAHHVRRLPVVVEDGTLVGIITRSDMLAVFLRDDDAIRRHLVEHVLPREFDLDPASFDVTVEDGIVTLRGQVPRRLLIHPLLESVRHTAGVIAVHDHLTYAVDDSVLPPRQPLP
jgi:CBS domain-containing protein